MIFLPHEYESVYLPLHKVVDNPCIFNGTIFNQRIREKYIFNGEWTE